MTEMDGETLSDDKLAEIAGQVPHLDANNVRDKRILSDEDVRQIRSEYRVVQTNARRAVNVIELANRYKVSQLTIRNIAKGRKYKEVI